GDGQAAAVLVDDGLHEGQAETHAAHAAADRVPRPVEALGEVRELVRRAARPVGDDPDAGAAGGSVVVLARDAHAHLATGRAVLHGVGEQVLHDLPQPARVGPQGDLGVAVRDDLDLRLVRDGPVGHDDVTDHADHVQLRG